ncbi:MAG: hypothetical protein Q7T93_17985 [Methylobacterium sp.]|uniref:hypothetical protein n=1 Tax=unclassified Methylobacterium TaxID=2615210 RepID=UPI0007007CCF|nr:MULTISPECIES: hypothetical protein [unclassified Methylobacterium]KQP07750.1 hypothetical protein ASF28_11545 [Methylobacterium sp. Leaf99]MDO9428702.1 hypothetical protein [Methylobacterium sp.]
MLRKLVLAALLALGFAATAPQGASAAPIGPALALQSEAAPAVAQTVQYYGYRRRFYGPRPFYRRPYYGRRFYGPRRFYGGPRRFYGPRPFYGPRRFY